MTNVNITNFRSDLFAYINQALEYNDVINVNTKNGNAVLMSEEDYNGLIETVHLLSIPGMKERLQEGMVTKIEDCEDFEW